MPVVVEQKLVELDVLLFIPPEPDERVESSVLAVTPPFQPAIERPQVERVPAGLLTMILRQHGDRESLERVRVHAVVLDRDEQSLFCRSLCFTPIKRKSSSK